MSNLEPVITSMVEILEISSGQRRCVFEGEGIFEAPNWSHDNKFLLLNRDGLLYRLDLQDGQVHRVNTDFATHCNNDHGISPDGEEIVISHHDENSEGGSVIYILPITGGKPRRVTSKWPSYWHGWSPDGSNLAYVAGRKGQDLKIYSVSVDGGEETQLTFGPGLDDGPDYSADGRYIYYNSFASGRMQIWRMDADGSNPMQIIESPHSDWFPHPSPDGRNLVFLRYLQDQVQAHPFGRDVQLMLLDLHNHQLSAATQIFYGGQGTINVPSWSPNSRELAFVSYRKD